MYEEIVTVLPNNKPDVTLFVYFVSISKTLIYKLPLYDHPVCPDWGTAP